MCQELQLNAIFFRSVFPNTPFSGVSLFQDENRLLQKSEKKKQLLFLQSQFYFLTKPTRCVWRSKKRSFFYCCVLPKNFRQAVSHFGFFQKRVLGALTYITLCLYLFSFPIFFFACWGIEKVLESLATIFNNILENSVLENQVKLAKIPVSRVNVQLGL